jgi:hypothetical protein
MNAVTVALSGMAVRKSLPILAVTGTGTPAREELHFHSPAACFCVLLAQDV